MKSVSDNGWSGGDGEPAYKNMKANSFCFTLNNYTPEDVERLRAYYANCRYLVFGYEVAPTTGTPHLQGFMQLDKKTRIKTLQKQINPTLHVEKARGTPDEAADYCKKGGQFEEFGTVCLPEDGGPIGGRMEKERWRLIWKHAKEHNVEAIVEMDAHVAVTSYNHIMAIGKNNLPEVDDAPGVTGLWIYGPSGVGKSYSVREVCRHHQLPMFDKPINKWWDGYKNEPVVLIDDFDKTHACLGHYLKRWADSYAFTAEIKCSAIRIRPNVIVVTSQYRIDQIWEDEETREAIGRRFIVQYFIDAVAALEWKEEEKRQPIRFSNRRSL